MATFKHTKPSGIHATFAYECVTCGVECTVTNSRPDPPTCRIDTDKPHPLEGRLAHEPPLSRTQRTPHCTIDSHP